MLKFNIFLKLGTGFLIFSASLPAAASKPACKVRDILAAQKPAQIPAGDFIDLGSGRGVYPNPYKTPAKRQWDYTGAPVRSDSEIEKIFESVRATTLAEIAAGKTAAQWTERQKIMIARIRNLKFKVETCEGGMGTASNAMLGQVITLCNMSRNMPLAGLIAVLGHEFGHSIDLCNLSKPYFKIDLSAPLERDLPEGADADQRSEIHDLGISLAEGRKDGGGYMIQSRTSPVIQSVYDGWLNRGLMTRVDGGVADDYNPARATYACLGKQSRGYEKWRDERGRCAASEAGAQIWGARALAEYLKKNPAASQDMFASMVSMADLDTGKPAIGGVGFGKEGDFNLIYLSEPEVQKALGCEPAADQNCMSYFDPTAGSVTGAAATADEAFSGR